MPKNVDTKGFFEGRLISCRGKQKVCLASFKSPYITIPECNILYIILSIYILC